MTEATIQEALQRAGVWCKPVSRQDLSTSRAGGESRRVRSPYPASKRLTYVKQLGWYRGRYTFRPRVILRRKVFIF